MAGSFLTVLHDKLIDHVLKTAPFTVPANIYVGMFSVAPTIAGGGTELTGNGYVRVVHNSWDAASAGHSENTGIIEFAPATGGDWLEAIALGLFDAITGGNFLGWADLDNFRTVVENDNAEFADGTLDVLMSA